jgi:hypothetical protein
MEDNADAVHTVLSELRIRKAIFVGHPWLRCLAELYPDYVKGLFY